MAVYRVKAATSEGHVVDREMEADSSAEVAGRLEKEGLFPIEVKAVGFASYLKRRLSSGNRAGIGELMALNQGLRALLKAGLPLVDAMETLGSSMAQTNLRRAVEDVSRDIRGGSSFSEALGKHPVVFSPLYASMIGAGERTGDLVPAISGYLDYSKKTEAIRKKVVSASIYPLVLAVASFVVVAFLLTYVVPAFTRIYADTGADLPAASGALIGLALFLRGHFAWIVLVVTAFVIGIRFWSASSSGARTLDAIKLKIPYVGSIVHGYCAGKFARTLSMVLGSGMPVIEALGLSRRVVGNSVLEAGLEKALKMASSGETLSKSMAFAGIFPDLTMRMFDAGERSASLASVLKEIAEYHEDDVAHRVAVLTDLIEPILMVAMGVIIGAIVVLMYLPIFQLGARI